MALIERLPDTSLTVALASGGRENFGWGADRHLKADIYDALNVNTRATGNWGKGGPPKIPSYPRPGVEEIDKKPASLEDIFKQLAGAPSVGRLNETDQLRTSN